MAPFLGMLLALPLILPSNAFVFRTPYIDFKRTQLYLLDPVSAGIGMDGAAGIGIGVEEAINVGIAVASAFVGTASQLPRIRALEQELKIARDSLDLMEHQMNTRISELEDKLFEIDREFENQTDRFKRSYDKQQLEDLERITKKMKVDFQYKLEIKLEEEKSKLLTKQLDLVNGVTGKRQAELAELRLRQIAMEHENSTLQKAQQKADEELGRLREASAKEQRWWPFQWRKNSNNLNV
jgi:hypothetical protein